MFLLCLLLSFSRDAMQDAMHSIMHGVFLFDGVFSQSVLPHVRAWRERSPAVNKIHSYRYIRRKLSPLTEWLQVPDRCHKVFVVTALV